MAEVVKRKDKTTCIWMNIAEIVFAYNTLKGEPIPAGTDYHAAVEVLQKEFGCDQVAATANTMDTGKYVRGEYDFQAKNKAKGINQ